MEELWKVFQVICFPLRGDVGWPAHVHGHEPCDYILWAYLKTVTYKNRPKTIEDNIDAIRQIMAEVRPKITLGIKVNSRNLLKHFSENGVQNMEDDIFKMKWIETAARCLRNTEIVSVLAIAFFSLSTFKMSTVFQPHTVYAISIKIHIYT